MSVDWWLVNGSGFVLIRYVKVARVEDVEVVPYVVVDVVDRTGMWRLVELVFRKDT